MKKVMIFAILLLIAFFPLLCEGGSGDYIILRANVNPLYIADESIFIQTFILVFQNGKPTDNSAKLDITISSIDGNYSCHQTPEIHGGRRVTINLPAVSEGHYVIRIQAEKGGIKSQLVSFEFGVSKAPVPYSVYFNQDGSRVHFRSGRLNETGNFDEKYGFTLKIWYSQYGSDAVPVKIQTNVTHADISIPQSIRKSLGVVYVDVTDIYGWKNSDTMDLKSFSFTGMPETYAYGYQHMEPWASRTLIRVAIAAVIIAVTFLLVMIAGQRRREV